MKTRDKLVSKKADRTPKIKRKLTRKQQKKIGAKSLSAVKKLVL